MKQKLLAVAVAAALAPFTASAADVTFSGTIRGVIDMTNMEDSTGQANDMEVELNRARLRVDVKQALDGGMTMNGYMRIQDGGSGVSVGQTGIYLSGGFGDLGIQGVGDSGNFGDTLGHLDIFETGAIVETGVFDQTNSSPNTLWYSSPDMGGLKIKMAVLTDDNTFSPAGTDGEAPQGTDFDTINPRITYTAGPLFVALGYVAGASSNGAGGSEDYSRINLGAKYKMDNITIGASYESRDDGTNTNSGAGVSVAADLGNIGVRVALASQSGDTDKGRVAAAGLDYKMGKGAKAFLEVYNLNKDLVGGTKAITGTQAGLRLDY